MASYISLGPMLLINDKRTQLTSQLAHSEEEVPGTVLGAASRMAPTQGFYHPTWTRSLGISGPRPWLGIGRLETSNCWGTKKAT